MADEKKKFKKWYDDAVMNMAAQMAQYCKKSTDNMLKRQAEERESEWEAIQRDNQIMDKTKKFFEEKCFPGLQNEGYKLAVEPASAIQHVPPNIRVICNYAAKTWKDGRSRIDENNGEFIVQEYGEVPGGRYIITRGNGLASKTWNTIKTVKFVKPMVSGSWDNFNAAMNECNEFIKQHIKETKIAALKAEREKGLIE